MVCGSAALPVTILNKWRKISGHTLLERYGMTEIGMALSNRLKGRRFPGYVGKPLANVQVRITDEENKNLPIGLPGEIQVKGPLVFKKYWNRDKETKESFTEDGWFKTGDIGIIENNNFKILGRNSIDIIKSGAYKNFKIIIFNDAYIACFKPAIFCKRFLSFFVSIPIFFKY